MSTANWTLEKNYSGSRVSIASLNVTALVVAKRSLAVSEMTINIAKQSMYDANLYAYNDVVTLWRNEVRWFEGLVTTMPKTGSAQDESHRYVVSDNWNRLQRIIYQQPFVLKSTDFTTLIGSASSHVTLGQDEWGNRIGTTVQIEKICNFGGVPVAPGLPTLNNSFLQDGRDMTCADAVRRMIALTPDCVSWFDYNAGTYPLLVLRLWAGCSAVDLDLNDKNLIESISDITPRWDLKINGVVFTFLTTEMDTDGVPWVRENRQTAGATTGYDVVFATVDLSNQSSDTPEVPPVGLATAYYNSRSTLGWQGTIILAEEDVSGRVQIGNRVNLLNGDTDWATMGAVVQTTTEDIFTGRTEVVVGPPEHLGPQDFISIMSAFQKKAPPSDFGNKQHNGTEGVPVGDGGVGGDPSVDEGSRAGNGRGGAPGGGGGGGGSDSITHCQSGSQVTTQVPRYV